MNSSDSGMEPKLGYPAIEFTFIQHNLSSNKLQEGPILREWALGREKYIFQGEPTEQGQTEGFVKGCLGKL